MTEKLEINKIAEHIFYLSPTLKIHSKECRYCHPDSEGWQQLESLAVGISQGYQACRLCCPSISETMNQQKTAVRQAEVEPLPESYPEKEEKLQSENETQLFPESNPQSSSGIEPSSEDKSPSNPLAESSNQASSKPNADSDSQPSSDSLLPVDDQLESETLSEDKKSKEKTEEKKRYKILAGNGCHQAIAEVRGMLVRPSEKGDKFKLILPDGLELDATFKTPHLKWLAFNQDRIIGLHWFRGYPKNEGG